MWDDGRGKGDKVGRGRALKPIGERSTKLDIYGNVESGKLSAVHR